MEPNKESIRRYLLQRMRDYKGADQQMLKDDRLRALGAGMSESAAQIGTLHGKAATSTVRPFAADLTKADQESYDRQMGLDTKVVDYLKTLKEGGGPNATKRYQVQPVRQPDGSVKWVKLDVTGGDDLITPHDYYQRPAYNPGTQEFERFNDIGGGNQGQAPTRSQPSRQSPSPAPEGMPTELPGKTISEQRATQPKPEAMPETEIDLITRQLRERLEAQRPPREDLDNRKRDGELQITANQRVQNAYKKNQEIDKAIADLEKESLDAQREIEKERRAEAREERKAETAYRLKNKYDTGKRSGANKLPSKAVSDYTTFQGAVKLAESLLDTIDKNEKLMGPVSGGVLGLNPYDEPRQNLIAEFDSMRQTIGKMREGGVLRKEDEAKYERILPNIKDLPEVARKKSARVVAELKSDLSRYMENFERAGYDVSGFADQTARYREDAKSPLREAVEGNKNNTLSQTEKVKVTNGAETLMIPRSDLEDAKADGFELVE